jgi:hypothetical protein
LFSPAFFLLAYDIFFNLLPYHEEGYRYIGFEWIFSILMFNSISLFCFFYLFSKKQSTNLTVDRPGIPLFVYYFAVIIIILFYAYLMIHVFGNLNLKNVLMNYGKFYAVSKRGTSWVFALFNFLIFLFLIDSYFNGIKQKKMIPFGICLLVTSFTGGRSSVIANICLLIFINTVIHNKKLHILKGLILLLTLFLFFSFNTVMRSGLDIETYLSKPPSKLDFNQLFVLDDVLNICSYDYFHEYLVDFQELKFMFIPRVLWPDKPMSTVATRLIYPAIAERGTSITFGIYANSWLNIRYLTFLYIPFFLISWNYMFYKAVLSRKLTFSYFLILFFSVVPVQIIRGGSIDMRLLRFLITIFLSHILYKIIISLKIGRKKPS